jgi:hypothetical protein
MVWEIGGLGEGLLNAYNLLLTTLPPSAQKFVGFLFIVILVVVYSIFIWKFYKSISTKNLFELNLNKYNKTEHPVMSKTLAIIFYIIEYLMVFPFLIFIWFAVFTIFLIFLTENLEIGALLLISATVIASIRLTSYYRKKLSEDLAKLIPFTLLAVSLLNPQFFSIERVFNQFQELSLIPGEILIYLVFIIILEVILRFVDFVFTQFNIKDPHEDIQVEEEE